MSEYAVREARKDEKLAILAFLRDHFYPREPILSAYLRKIWDKVSEEQKRYIQEDLDTRHEIMLGQQPCLVAVHRDTQKIAGVNLMTLKENPALAASYVRNCGSDNKNLEGAEDSVHLKSRILTDWFDNVLGAADREVNIFEMFPTVKTILDLIIVCVDPNHGKKGLATTLMSEAINWARDKKADMVCSLLTSPYSRKVGEKLGFQKCAEIDWLSFRDSDGNLFYEDMDSYILTFMALKLK